MWSFRSHTRSAGDRARSGALGHATAGHHTDFPFRTDHQRLDQHHPFCRRGGSAYVRSRSAQGLSAWAAQRPPGRGTRPQYEQFERPAFAPPGAVFPVVWSELNLTTATSAWRIWRAREPGEEISARRAALAWWALAVAVRSGYTPLAFGGRPLWAATADAALLFAIMARYSLLAREVDQAAALLAVPEVAWTGFATMLSTAVAAKNSRKASPPGQTT
jgi:translocator protein